MPVKKPKSRKKVPPKQLQALAQARLYKDATYEARRPLGYTRAHEPDQSCPARLHGSVVALTLLCACCQGGTVARWLVAAAIPREHRVETVTRTADRAGAHPHPRIPPCPTPPHPARTPVPLPRTPCGRTTTPPSSPTRSVLPTCASATTTMTTRARSCPPSTTSCRLHRSAATLTRARRAPAEFGEERA